MNSNFNVRAFAEVISKDKRTFEMFCYLINNSYIRVVNYHNTNDIDAERFDKEIKYFSEHFVPVTIKDIDTFFETKKWPYEKPGLIPAIFEGYRSHYDIIRPILDKYNLVGWFYIPSFFVDVKPEDQLEFCHSHRLRTTGQYMYPDGRIALSWDEIKELSKCNEICCHTGSHFEITKDTSDEDMHREIVESKLLLEQHIGKQVDVFCWLAGEEYNYNIRAHKHLEEAGYKYVLSNLKLEKIK
jgi:peptidoglycan/xylan/chitin deacetylase (PgdA/CDA1 family)